MYKEPRRLAQDENISLTWSVSMPCPQACDDILATTASCGSNCSSNYNNQRAMSIRQATSSR